LCDSMLILLTSLILPAPNSMSKRDKLLTIPTSALRPSADAWSMKDGILTVSFEGIYTWDSVTSYSYTSYYAASNLTWRCKNFDITKNGFDLTVITKILFSILYSFLLQIYVYILSRRCFFLPYLLAYSRLSFFTGIFFSFSSCTVPDRDV